MQLVDSLFQFGPERSTLSNLIGLANQMQVINDLKDFTAEPDSMKILFEQWGLVTPLGELTSESPGPVNDFSNCVQEITL